MRNLVFCLLCCIALSSGYSQTTVPVENNIISEFYDKYQDFAKNSVVKLYISVVPKMFQFEHGPATIVGAGTGVVIYSKEQKNSTLNIVRIMTCAHVVDHEEFSQDGMGLVFLDNQQYNFKIIATDHKYDIAILEGQLPNNFVAVKLSEKSISDGDKISLFGYGGNAETVRILQSEAHRLTNYYSIYVDVNVICGDSGGPILNEKGELVSLITAFCVRDTDFEKKQGAFGTGVNYLPIKKYYDKYSK